MSEMTRILSAIEQGDPQAPEKLLPLVYDELRKLAAARLAHEKPGQTLQATALVHEAYLRLLGSPTPNSLLPTPAFSSRGHFFAAAAEAMRRILVEQARRKCGPRKGGRWQRRDAELDVACESLLPDQVLDVDEALEKLAAENAPVARFVELRYFGGLTLDEAAAALGISSRTATRYWVYAKAWLREELHDAEPR